MGFYTVIAVPRIYEILKNSDVISHCILGNIPLGMNITTSIDISLSRNRQIDRFSYVMSFCQVVICTSTAPDRSSLVMRAQNASRIIFPSILNLVLEESACCFFFVIFGAFVTISSYILPEIPLQMPKSSFLIFSSAPRLLLSTAAHFYVCDPAA